MKLFDEYPVLYDDAVIMNRITADDIPALEAVTGDPRVTKTIPAFLYEQKYDDKHLMLENLDDECFQTKESLLLAVRLKEDGFPLVGVAEIYNYEEDKKKASIGYRGAYAEWGKGIATRVVMLFTDYLFGEAGLKTITAHVLSTNHASKHVLEKCGFINKHPGHLEDWGHEEPQLTDTFVLKKAWLGQTAE